MGIGARAFVGTGLKEIRLPEGLQVIGSTCFAGMDNLEYVYIPSTVGQIGYEVFKNSPNLKRIDFVGTKEEWDEMLRATSHKEMYSDHTIDFMSGATENVKINFLDK